VYKPCAICGKSCVDTYITIDDTIYLHAFGLDSCYDKYEATHRRALIYAHPMVALRTPVSLLDVCNLTSVFDVLA